MAVVLSSPLTLPPAHVVPPPRLQSLHCFSGFLLSCLGTEVSAEKRTFFFFFFNSPKFSATLSCWNYSSEDMTKHPGLSQGRGRRNTLPCKREVKEERGEQRGREQDCSQQFDRAGLPLNFRLSQTCSWRHPLGAGKKREETTHSLKAEKEGRA